MLTYNRVKQFSDSSETSKELCEAMRIYAENDMAERGYKNKKFSDVSKSKMEEAVNKSFFTELQHRTNMTVENNFAGSLKRFSNNPVVVSMADDIRDYLVDMILPETLLNGPMGYIAEFKFADLGDSMTFNLDNNSLYTVSRAGYRLRNTNLQKLSGTTATLIPENRMITVGSDLFEILTGRVSMAQHVMKAVRSIETALYFDAYEAFATAMNGLTGALAVSNYSENSLITLCETVGAYNQGQKPVILGTPVALKSVLPSNSNYRYLLDDDYVKLGYLQNFNTYDVIPLAQVANPYDESGQYKLKLDDTKIYVVSPSSDKLVKIGIGGESTSHTDAVYDNANLLQMTTINKAWDVDVITNSVAGCVKKLS